MFPQKSISTAQNLLDAITIYTGNLAKSAHPLLLAEFPIYCIATKFTHSGSSFTWLVQCTLWGGGGGGKGRGGVRSTASSAKHIGGKELCVTLF